MVFKHALFMKNCTAALAAEFGFTLLEVIVSIFILGILATIMVVQLNNEDPVAELDRNARAAVNVLQLARSYATSSYQCCEGEVIYGYGVRFYNSNHYLLYVDKDDSRRYNSGEMIEEYYLDADNYFETNDDIFFSLTEAVVYSGGSALGSSSKTITLINTETEKNIDIQGLTAAISYE